MSLRARITLVNIVVLGGILLLFSAVVYSLVTASLIEQIDNTLIRTVDGIIPDAQVDSRGHLQVIRLPMVEIPNVYVQAWSRGGRLEDWSPNLGSFRQPLDPAGLQSAEPVFRDTVVGGLSLRVLTVPLEIGDRAVGTLQAAMSTSVVVEAQGALLGVMALAAVASMSLVGVMSWLTTRSTLSDLHQVTQRALEITRTNDLSRRIPLKESADEEIRVLIQSFNLTLSRLERLISAQRRFLADVGHELRTPLTVIKGNVDLMRRFGSADEESLGGIESEVDRLTRLVGDLLLLAQAESGKLPLDRQNVELDTLLLEVYRQARVLARDRLDVRIGEIDQISVCGDRDRLKQVFLNLVGNAVKYTPPEGQVVLSLGKASGQARLTVRDTGPGIPAEDMPYVFERFYRGEKSRLRSKDGRGFGLGLSIAYWIVHNHGGRIEVDSQIGQGTTFCVWLPLAEGDCAEEGLLLP